MTLRWNWGTGIALVYGTFATCTLGFAVYAMEQTVDLVSPDYYAQALKQDERMAAVDRVHALGSAFAVTVKPASREVVIAIPAAAREGVTGTVTFYRPSDAASDRTVPMTVDASGVAHAPLNGLASGHWTLKVNWTSGGKPYYFEEPILLP